MGGDRPGWVRRLSTNELFRRINRLRRRLDEPHGEDEKLRRMYATLMDEYQERIRTEE